MNKPALSNHKFDDQCIDYISTQPPAPKLTPVDAQKTSRQAPSKSMHHASAIN